MADQLDLGETCRDDTIELIVHDRHGRGTIDRIPCHLGKRHEHRDIPSLHEATLWAYIAQRNANRHLPPPAHTTTPGHDPSREAYFQRDGARGGTA